jgi:hypothetical protein
MTPPPGSERREHKRAAVRFKAELKEVGAAEIQEMFPDAHHKVEAATMPVHHGECVNLSIGGGLVAMPQPPVRNRMMALAVHLSSHAAPIYALCLVIWVAEDPNTSHGHRHIAGLRFLAISREDLGRVALSVQSHPEAD